jgi:hypothetical protein
MMADEENEDLLVALMRCGDVRAFERLLVRLHQPLHSYITRLVGESLTEDGMPRALPSFN